MRGAIIKYLDWSNIQLFNYLIIWFVVKIPIKPFIIPGCRDVTRAGRPEGGVPEAAEAVPDHADYVRGEDGGGGGAAAGPAGRQGDVQGADRAADQDGRGVTVISRWRWK